MKNWNISAALISGTLLLLDNSNAAGVGKISVNIEDGANHPIRDYRVGAPVGGVDKCANSQTVMVLAGARIGDSSKSNQVVTSKASEERINLCGSTTSVNPNAPPKPMSKHNNVVNPNVTVR